MGITGLLPFLKKSCRRSKIDEFYGKTAAVDVCCWLHKGAFGCADKLAKNEETDFYVQFVLKYVKMLLSHRIHVILVFDGASLPAKKQVDLERRERRHSMKSQGKRLLAEGKNAEAFECFRKCTEVTFEMISNVIKMCSKLPNVDCIVAPHESDAQLAKFSNSGIADIIITEDSDLVVFGCSKILFKMDANGHGTLYEKENLHLSLGISEEKVDFAKFRRACILAGCDYFKGLDGVGLIKANKFFKKTSQNDLRKVLPKVAAYLQMSKLADVDKTFIENFIKAENTFLYQIIFDVQRKTTAPLNPYPEDMLAVDEEDLSSYTGKVLDPEVSYQLAVGDLNPYTLKKVNDFGKLYKSSKLLSKSIWNAVYDVSNRCSEDEKQGEAGKRNHLSSYSFETTPSCIVVKQKSPVKKETELIVQKSVVTGSTPVKQASKEKIRSVTQRVTVVSRHFTDSIPEGYENSIASQYEEKTLKQENRSALEILAGLDDGDDGAFLSKGQIKSPLKRFEKKEKRTSNEEGKNEKSPIRIIQELSCSPIISKKKRSFVASPSNNIESTRKSLKQFCYVSPTKLFERSQCKASSQQSTDPPLSSYDSGVGTNANDESVESALIDLTEEEDEGCSELYGKQKDSPQALLEPRSKFLGKCKNMGLRKSASAPTALKQSNIKDMFAAFAYKKC